MNAEAKHTNVRHIPVVFAWVEVTVDIAHPKTGEMVSLKRMAMVPRKKFRGVADRQFAAGEEYPLVVLEARSRASHSHYFAALNEAFKNLPEKIADRWLDSEHFRAWLLIQTNWCNEFEVTCAKNSEAVRLASRFKSENAYSQVSIHGTKVIVRTAKSQSVATMGKQEFESSKRDVLDLAAEFIGTPRADLEKHAKKGSA